MAAVKSKPQEPEKVSAGLPKSRTGIRGLDEITFGGLPQGRPTPVCGGPGCGKTLLGMEFLIRGATQFNEPGVCLSFEETAEELSRNVASLGFDVDRLVASNKLSIDYIFIERGLIEETGEYDLEALFLRLGYAVEHRRQTSVARQHRSAFRWIIE
jgi:circadian clock protein KaiC